MYIGTQHRDGDIADFFAHENQNFPPSLSVAGNLRTGTKSDLLENFKIPQTEIPSEFDCSIFDGPALVHFLLPQSNVRPSMIMRVLFSFHFLLENCNTFSVLMLSGINIFSRVSNNLLETTEEKVYEGKLSPKEVFLVIFQSF
eukprot:Pompholyxophrys_punicea_v1_NODE_10_length_6905_cov_7.951686.p7 type:complete len:143 gc:universal NODE_10_length_6905_cov_7.951686:4030-3602(-)